MTPPDPPWRDHDRYTIRVAGHLDDRWSAWFDGVTLTQQADGTTVIDTPGTDQAALHGLLLRIRDAGLQLISVGRTGADDH
jgi:hypothetical protein